jgi:hypothetical protein
MIAGRLRDPGLELAYAPQEVFPRVADALLLLQLPGPVLVPDQVARVPRVGESGDLQGALGRQVLAGPVGLLVPGSTSMAFS